MFLVKFRKGLTGNELIRAVHENQSKHSLNVEIPRGKLSDLSSSSQQLSPRIYFVMPMIPLRRFASFFSTGSPEQLECISFCYIILFMIRSFKSSIFD